MGENQHGFYYDSPKTPSDYTQWYRDWTGDYCEAIEVADSNYHKCSDPSSEKCCKKICNYYNSPCGRDQVYMDTGDGKIGSDKFGYFYRKN